MRPALHHPILAALYDTGPELPAGFLEQVRSLPADTLETDLAALIRYFIDDYESYRDNDQTGGFLQVDSAVTYGLGTRSFNFTDEQRHRVPVRPACTMA